MGVKIINLYNRGDECTDITGGWYIQRYSGSATPTLTKLSDRMEIKAPEWSANHVYMNVPFRTRGNATVFIEYSLSGGYGSYAYVDYIMSAGTIISISPASKVLDAELFAGINVSNLNSAVLTIYRIWIAETIIEPTWGGGLASVTQKELLARRFEIMPRKLWLYKDGNECVNVTGGWETAITRGGKVEKLTDAIKITSSGLNQVQLISTARRLNMTNYSKLCSKIRIVAQRDYRYCELSTGIFARTPSVEWGVRVIKQPIGGYQVEVDISQFENYWYVGLQGYYLDEGYINEVWLE